MASINFNVFKKKQYSNEYTYVDLNLDITEQKPYVGNTNSTGRDLKVAFDIDAIKNSLINLFNTSPKERLLLPDYGCDIRRYIFEQINSSNAQMIGDEIYNAIVKWESRVRVKNVYVQPKPDENMYNIVLRIAIPFSEQYLDISSIFNSQGYIII